ncbi:Adenine nucleotide alpha hydrolase [Fusarium albosuccineum]|uniref:Adenine nucleotide alpha hydrolase n=1 Tax=Fusarium albosuccineum TaxID=1237068 RepID=A0A8H4L9T7_9HYPO|nr:Adenine nucleotide alpha hydrolase [Fusarium albosuccineum]
MRTRRQATQAETGESSSSAARGRKRSSGKTESPATKKAKKSQDDAPSSQPEQRPRLTTPDLEFDFDRSQLRDPRPTPGRVKRPRYSSNELDDDFKARFTIPTARGSATGDTEFARKARADPSHSFHHLYVCHKKGPNGSPTYDDAGFQLDYDKVAKWMKPTAYNKKAMVNGMNRRLEEDAKEVKAMTESFFIDGKGPGGGHTSDYKFYLQDHVSKDLGVPWHQIDSKKVAEWANSFDKIDANEWWREPNEEERKRFMKMLGGASLRKDI